MKTSKTAAATSKTSSKTSSKTETKATSKTPVKTEKKEVPAVESAKPARVKKIVPPRNGRETIKKLKAAGLYIPGMQLLHRTVRVVYLNGTEKQRKEIRQQLETLKEQVSAKLSAKMTAVMAARKEAGLPIGAPKKVKDAAPAPNPEIKKAQTAKKMKAAATRAKEEVAPKAAKTPAKAVKRAA